MRFIRQFQPQGCQTDGVRYRGPHVRVRYAAEAQTYVVIAAFILTRIVHIEEDYSLIN
jgi:hypothetical protein